MDWSPHDESDPGDLYGIKSGLTPDERQVLERVAAFMHAEVAPEINRSWRRAEFPHHLVAPMAGLGATGYPYRGYGCPGGRFVVDSLISMEIARVDPSIVTFFGVHSGLAMGSIYLCGSEEQKQWWLPPMARHEKTGAFALTEPGVGSRAAGGRLGTTARREGDVWVSMGTRNGSAMPPSPM